MFGCVWMARGNDCEVVAKMVEEHGGRRFLVITGWGMLGSSHWWLGFGGNDMHWQLEYGDIQTLTSSWQWQEPMLLLKRYPQNKQDSTGSSVQTPAISSDFSWFTSPKLGHQEVSRSLEAWKLAAGSAQGFDEPWCQGRHCWLMLIVGAKTGARCVSLGHFSLRHSSLGYIISSFEGQQVFCCC